MTMNVKATTVIEADPEIVTEGMIDIKEEVLVPVIKEMIVTILDQDQETAEDVVDPEITLEINAIDKKKCHLTYSTYTSKNSFLH
jgi:hypothetical protein